MKAPQFTSRDKDGNTVSLQSHKGKWVVLYFYPKDNTPGCTIEALDFTTLLPEFRALNATVLGCSPDSEKSHCSFTEKQGLTITLLSDPDKKVIQSYHAWGQKKFMGKSYEGVIRSTFLITPLGEIAHQWTDVKAKGHAQAVLDELKNLS